MSTVARFVRNMTSQLTSTGGTQDKPTGVQQTHVIFDNLFLSVGAQKAGTTWLYSLIYGHPDIYFTPEKEIHYFAHLYTNEKRLGAEPRLARVKQKLAALSSSQASIAKLRSELSWYSGYLADPVDDDWLARMFARRRGQKYCADFSNLNCHIGEQDWAKVRLRTRNLKVIYIMRDPVQRLWSHLKFFLQFSGNSAALDTLAPGDILELARRPYIWRNSDYSKIVSTLRRALTPDELRIVFYEDIHADARAWLYQLEQFLDVQHIQYSDDKLNKHVNASAPRPVPDFFPALFADEFRRQYADLRAMGLTLPAQWTAL